MARMAGVNEPDLLRTSYGAFAGVLRDVDEDASWQPTGCLGWTVRDLTYHCLGDAQRALVALHTPTDAEPDRDAVTYWADWAPDTTGSANGRRHIRVQASMFLVWEQLRDLHAETVAAVGHAAGQVDLDRAVATQGHVLPARDLLSTLCVEATIHHLDLVAELPDAPGPSAEGLREVRRVLDGLLGTPAPSTWPDDRYARVATGRVEPTAQERDVLGDRVPVFS
jgi:hypothetical protein